MTKEDHYSQGLDLLFKFCATNRIPAPDIWRLGPHDRLYHLATCAYYRPTRICIMVKKCAHIGLSGMAWSCPGYKIDRTPYGVLQHELGHHIGWFFSEHYQVFFERAICLFSNEKPLTGYLGTSKGEEANEYYKEWFAEHFRLFVTNPKLSQAIAPKFFAKLIEYVIPVEPRGWREVLVGHGAPERTLAMAERIVRHD